MIKTVTHLTIAQIDQVRRHIRPEISRMRQHKNSLQVANRRLGPNPHLDRYFTELQELRSRLICAMDALKRREDLEQWEQDVVVATGEVLTEIEEVLELAIWFGAESLHDEADSRDHGVRRS